MYNVGDIVRFIHPFHNKLIKAKVIKKQTDKLISVFSDDTEPKFYVINIDLVKIISWQDEPSSDLVRCSKCNLLNEYAVPNQDNGTYLCYECRNK